MDMKCMPYVKIGCRKSAVSDEVCYSSGHFPPSLFASSVT